MTALDLAKEEEETDVVKLLEDWIKSHPQVRVQFAHETIKGLYSEKNPDGHIKIYLKR